MADEIQNIKIRITTDADFSDLDQSLQKLTAEEKALKEQIKGVDDAAKKAGDSIQNESQKAHTEVNKTTKGFQDLRGEVKNLAQNIPGAFQVGQISSFAKAIGSATGATGGLSGAMNILKVAIISTGIGALVVLLGSVVAYFTQTERGADKLAKIMNVLGVFVDELVNLLSLLGDVVVQAFEYWLQGAKMLYDFWTGVFFKAIEATAEILASMGFDDAAKSVNEFNDALKQGKADIEAYTSSMVKLGEEIADLEDKLGAMAIDISLANNRLTTEIDRSLKALRNRNLTYAEGLEIIKDISSAEEERLKNTKDLIQVELDLKEKQFLRDEGNTRRAKELFSQFVNAQITAQELLNQVKGKANEESIRGIAEVLNKQEDAVRESMVLEERLQNIRDQFAQKEAERLEKLKAYYDLQNRYRAQDLNLEVKKNNDDLKAFEKTIDGKKKLQDLYYKNLEAQRAKDEAAARETLARDLREAEELEANKKALKQQAVVDITEIGNGLFQLQKDAINQELTETQLKHQAELKSVGDNKQAQAVINAKYAKIEADLKRKQAQTDKDQAIFNIFIQTAVNTVKALGTPPVPNIALAALVGGLGAAQLAFAASKPIPKFKDGTKGLNGGNGGVDDILIYANKGEGIMPTDRMKDYQPAFNAIFDRKVPADFLNSIVMNYDRLGSMVSAPQADMSGLKSEIRALGSKLDKLQTLNVTMDQKGFKSYLSKGNSKTELENNYLRVG